jgi:CheY-like chemotaxis protein
MHTAVTNGFGEVKGGPIVYVEDSGDDRMIFEIALQDLGITNKLILFKDGEEALCFLKSMKEIPFVILSDVNMPKMDGFELKREIESIEELRVLAIPFIYLSTSSARKDVKTAFYHQAQGYFEKPGDIGGLQRIIKLTLDYWSASALPSDY